MKPLLLCILSCLFALTGVRAPIRRGAAQSKIGP